MNSLRMGPDPEREIKGMQGVVGGGREEEKGNNGGLAHTCREQDGGWREQGERKLTTNRVR